MDVGRALAVGEAGRAVAADGVELGLGGAHDLGVEEHGEDEEVDCADGLTSGDVSWGCAKVV